MEQADASGLLYRRNRYYDPGSGRFTQPDPIGLAGGLNVYGFANGDPVNFSDPFGLRACDPPGSPCPRGMQILAEVARQTAPLERVVEGVGEAVGLRDLAEGGEQLLSGDAGGALQVAMVIPAGRSVGTVARVAGKAKAVVRTAKVTVVSKLEAAAVRAAHSPLGEGFREGFSSFNAVANPGTAPQVPDLPVTVQGRVGYFLGVFAAAFKQGAGW
jgi:RHS repeat-associated protein